MKKVFSKLADIFTVFYFLLMLLSILICIAAPIRSVQYIYGIIQSGYGSEQLGYFLLLSFGAFVAPSLLIPPLRKRLYSFFPWLYAFIKISFCNLFILALACIALNYGYEFLSSSRHLRFIALTLVILVIGRLLVCLYFHKRPISPIREGVTMDYSNNENLADSSPRNSFFKRFLHVRQREESPESKKAKHEFQILGVLILLTTFISMQISKNAFDPLISENQNYYVFQYHLSKEIAPGAVLHENDGVLNGRDFIVPHTSTAKETQISIWDYAAQDGDYVQILVDETPITEPFMVTSQLKHFRVPTTGNIQVKGIRDGDGGGITYAIYVELNETSYFNNASENGLNTYTLLLEQGDD